MLTTLLTLNGCDRNASPQADIHDSSIPVGELKSEQKTFEQTAGNCSDAEECASVVINREVFDQRPELNRALDQQLLMQLQGNDEEQKNPESLTEIAEQFLKEAAEVEKVSSARWQLRGETKQLSLRGDLLTMEISSYRYTGGAHGMPSEDWFNWDLSTDKRVSLGDVIREGQEQKFWDLARAAHQRWLDGQKGIDEDFRKIWPFQHSDTFRFTDEGLVLLYGVYTLGPYAFGPVELTIPNGDLSGVIRERYLPKSTSSK
ncbi:DUF3298 and DUF4163 domain-containing protein [Microbulbifer hainanensis]|uniref:DUF3298 and DUF4163 domain-containing protein n=1 Tax=Microbulbifer hainanensis TaxID=2735675 RepID=UPI001868F616|nr:DUF3298 and DUF4163 domain-containing protein [Microbulbifer hainanensis]